MITRLDHNEQTYEIGERGSRYVDRLHKHLEAAHDLATEVDNLNPDYLKMGAGKMARLKELAAEVLK